VIRRLIDKASIHRFPPPACSASQRRRGTDQTSPFGPPGLGFASLQAYLVARVTWQSWPLTQVASELSIHRNTVSDRLDCYGLRRAKQTAR
jgi:hypothetical protein